jgi:hypothetical protein
MSYGVIIEGGQDERCGTIRRFIPYEGVYPSRGNPQLFVFRVTSERDYRDVEIERLRERSETVTLDPTDVDHPGRFPRWRIRTDEITDDQIDEYLAAGFIAVDELAFFNLTEAIDTRERFDLPDVVPFDKRPDHAGPLHQNLNVSLRLQARNPGVLGSGRNMHRGRRP